MAAAAEYNLGAGSYFIGDPVQLLIRRCLYTGLIAFINHALKRSSLISNQGNILYEETLSLFSTRSVTF
jgi:hypothetical protein